MQKHDPDTASILELLSNNQELLTSGTQSGEYFRWIWSICHDYTENPHKEEYIDNINEERSYTGKRPFLTIVMRTQGKRVSQIREALLCLWAQTNRDFELIIVGHKVADENRNVIQRVIREQECAFRERIRYYEVDYGTRSAPLNYGFSHARGMYIVNCDDDDTVTQDWVNGLYERSLTAKDCLLHVYTVTQAWSEVDVNGAKAVRADDIPRPRYCRPFSQTIQLHQNLCPFFSIAFPAFLFNKLNIWFDEELDTTEDWEYIMRTSLLVGVSDIEKTPLVYRLWSNADSSHTVNDENAWEKYEERIKRKVDEYPVVLKRGSAREIEAFYTNTSHYAKRIRDEEVKFAKKVGYIEATKYYLKSFINKDSRLYRTCQLVYKRVFLRKGH